MKDITLILFFMLNSCFLFSQEIHLSYNLFEEKNQRKSTNEVIIFFIGENYFTHKKNEDYFKSIDTNKKLTSKILNIEDFLNIAHQLKIKDKNNKGIIVKKKNKIFKSIFLYEKRENCIYVYGVDWVDAVVN